jgi:hypothetical protein
MRVRVPNVRSLLVATVAVLLIGVNASVHGSIVWNGGFDNVNGGNLGWPRGNSSTIMTPGTVNGHSALTRTSTTTGVSYQIDDAAHSSDGGLYTINNSLGQATAAMPANELGTANPGWIPGGTSESYTFSFQYARTGTGTAGTGSVKLYVYTGAGAPPYDVNSQSYLYMPLGTSSPNWTLVYDSGTLGAGTVQNAWNDAPANGATGSLTGTFTGQPEYFGIVLTGVSGFAFDSISLDTQCESAVPEPATIIVWSLLGTASWLGVRVARRRGMRPGSSRPGWLENNRVAIHEIIARGVRN